MYDLIVTLMAVICHSFMANVWVYNYKTLLKFLHSVSLSLSVSLYEMKYSYSTYTIAIQLQQQIYTI